MKSVSNEQIHRESIKAEEERRGEKNAEKKICFDLVPSAAHMLDPESRVVPVFFLPFPFSSIKEKEAKKRRSYVKGRHRPVCNSSNHWKEVFRLVRFGVRGRIAAVWSRVPGRTSAPIHDPDIDLPPLFPSSLLLTVIDLAEIPTCRPPLPLTVAQVQINLSRIH